MMCCRDLKHPNIVQLLAYAICEEEIVLVTNFVDGNNLDKILFGKESVEVLYSHQFQVRYVVT